MENIKITNFDKLYEITNKYKDTPGRLMPVLQDVQEEYGYLPIEVQKEIASELNIPLAEVYGVATFYSQFTLKKKGKYVIGVCMGTACYVKNAQLIIDKLKDILEIGLDETTPDDKFTLEQTRCLGCCGLAPVMVINDDVYGGLSADEIPGILEKY